MKSTVDVRKTTPDDMVFLSAKQHVVQTQDGEGLELGFYVRKLLTCFT